MCLALEGVQISKCQPLLVKGFRSAPWKVLQNLYFNLSYFEFSVLIFGSWKREVFSADTKRDLGEVVCFIQHRTFNLLCLICRSLKFIELSFHLVALTSAQAPLPTISQDHMLMHDPFSLLFNQPAHVIVSQHYSFKFLPLRCAIWKYVYLQTRKRT